MGLRIAFTGSGYIARIHAAAAQAAGAEVVAVASHREPSRREFVERFGVPRDYATVGELLAAGGIDGLVVCTPNALHAPESIAALDAGVAVLVEKPMALNAAEADAMAAAAAKAGRPLMIAHCWRFDDETRWLRDRIASGAIGRVVRTTGYGVHVDWGPKGWFRDPALAGGGAMMDMGIHALDTARFLLGDPMPASVFGRIGTEYVEMDVDDHGLVIVTWEDGRTTTIESGWWAPQMGGPEASTELWGIEGYARLFPTSVMARGAAIDDPGFASPRVPHCLPSMYESQMRAFLEAVRSGVAPDAGPAVGTVNMRILDAAYESSRTGEVVRLSR